MQHRTDLSHDVLAKLRYSRESSHAVPAGRHPRIGMFLKFEIINFLKCELAF